MEFCKSHGIIKNEIVKTAPGMIKLSERCYYISSSDQIELFVWDDEHTIWYKYGPVHTLELWASGKAKKRFKYHSIANPTVLSACLDLYSKQETFQHDEELDAFSRL